MSRCFFDTNILLYAHDPADRARQKLARGLLAQHLRARTAVVSTQVLQEFFSVVTRKFGLPAELAREEVLTWSKASVVQVTPELILSAIDLHRLHSVNFWDALVLRAAAAGNCGLLYSEDLNAGQSYDGVLVRDPFTG